MHLSDAEIALGGLVCTGIGLLVSFLKIPGERKSSKMTDLRNEIDLYKKTTDGRIDNLVVENAALKQQVEALTQANKVLTESVTQAAKVDLLISTVDTGFEKVNKSLDELKKGLTPA